LTGPLEVDDLYVGGIQEGRGAGRKSDSAKAIVAAAVELRGKGPGRLRLSVIPDLSAGSLCGFVTDVVGDAVVHTDCWQGYRHLKLAGYEHHRSSQRQAATGERLLPRVHRSISNLKAWLQGTHRHVGREHLQIHLDAFAFRHTRRRTPMAAFHTLLGLGAQHSPTTHSQSPSAPLDRSHGAKRTCRTAVIEGAPGAAARGMQAVVSSAPEPTSACRPGRARADASSARSLSSRAGARLMAVETFARVESVGTYGARPGRH
jgi:ISXO2-like transposase domain